VAVGEVLDQTRPVTDEDTSALDRARYVSLTTFRRNGDPVATPVWTVRHEEGWACTTGATSGKVARLRHTDRIEVAPCDVRGRVADGAPRYSGTARVVEDPAEYRRVRSAVVRRYWVLGPALVAWGAIGRLLGRSDGEGAVVWTVDGRA
jgi:PPOX class probable F420-dependent enzyme